MTEQTKIPMPSEGGNSIERDSQLVERLGLHDRTIIWKRVKRMNQQAVRPDVGLNETQCRWRQAIRRVETVRERRTLAVQQQLLMHVQKDFRRQSLNLIAHVNADAARNLD